MLYPIAVTALGSTLFTSVLAAQELVPSEATRSVTPVTAVDRSANPPREEREAPPTPVDDTDLPVLIQDEMLDDRVPLPIPARYEASDAGDVLVEEASGDPHFLGFAGASHYPPATEILDPLMIQAAALRQPDARPEAVTYGFVMFFKRITPERVSELEELGVRVLGFHPHYAMRVALPVDVIGAVSTLDFVRWVGSARLEQKLHPALDAELDKTPAGEKVRIYVSVFESDMNDASTFTRIGRVDTTGPVPAGESAEDRRTQVWQSNGWMQAALEEAGAEVISYSPRLDTFQVLIDRAQIESIAARDFVQFIEPTPEAQLNAVPHDESRAMIATDHVVNNWDGGTNQAAIVGVVDSGIEISHADLSIFGVGWNCTTESSPWDDIDNSGNGHGTHVTGTILGRGVAEADQEGNASGLASWGGNSRLFNYRRFPNPCSVGLDSIASTFNSPYSDGAGATTPRPHVVNNSWGSTIAGVPVGTEFNARAADSAVFDQDQLWVWSAGNSGPGASTLGIESSAKNVFTVGNVIDYISTTVGDPGSLWTSSSRGPTADNRWKPNVTAPGRQIRSALANNNTGYANYSGTSMAAPHVTATAAILADRSATFRYAPERMMSLLMASATTKDNLSLTTPSSSHLDTYGAGRVNSFKNNLAFGGNTYTNWGFELNGNQSTFADFTVPAGTTRIIVVMAGIEGPASAGASAALVNDYDLYIDRDPIDPAGNVGEYTAQQSTVDNCEIRMINNPAAGPWRWKVYPDGATSLTKLSVTVYYVADDTTPDATLTLTAADQYIQPNDVVDVTATVNNDDYVASAVVLDRSGSAATVVTSSTVLGDGTVTDLTDSISGGSDIVLGDIIDFFPRAGTWGVSYSTEGTKVFSVEARSDNMINKSASVNIVVDGTMPGAVSNLTSPSHAVNQWSNDPTVTWTWTAASDSLSGIQGYGIFESTSAGSPGATLDIGATTTYTSGAYATSTSGRYFNIRSVDRADNWDNDFVSAGPYFIDTVAPLEPTSIQSTSHPVGVARCEQLTQVRFTGASDAHSGIDGYSIVWSTSPGTTPNTSVNTTSTTVSRTNSPGSWYLHVRTIDRAGNASGTAHFGPFVVTATCGTIYCNSNPNSSGSTATMRAQGSDDASDNDLTVQALQLPTNTVGYFLASPTAGFVANPVGSQGNLCLGGNIGRYSATVLNSGATGSFQLALNLAAIPTPTGSTSAAAGSTYRWQAWFRDANPAVTSNFTNGIQILFY
ncbi:Bacillopeptidase F precursor [Planctomycetes bacterium Poly30]|uniref:Bacillopeptidase F n=1 Tax=Saltatorellus ferox TaxID=2528018 RepID=A0A518EPJ0_9BACT|nr:Bacillopeptidase F precursor [Planctomycetes bacterium Poly30]